MTIYEHKEPAQLGAQRSEGAEVTHFKKPLELGATNSEADDAISGYQSTDFQTAYENQSSYNNNAVCCDSVSENDLQKGHANAIKDMIPFSAEVSRRGSFSITTASELHHDHCTDCTDSEILNSSSVDESFTGDVTAAPTKGPIKMVAPTSAFKLNATPFFVADSKKHAVLDKAKPEPEITEATKNKGAA